VSRAPFRRALQRRYLSRPSLIEKRLIKTRARQTLSGGNTSFFQILNQDWKTTSKRDGEGINKSIANVDEEGRPGEDKESKARHTRIHPRLDSLCRRAIVNLPGPSVGPRIGCSYQCEGWKERWRTCTDSLAIKNG
jgi:hypothetical protein